MTPLAAFELTALPITVRLQPVAVVAIGFVDFNKSVSNLLLVISPVSFTVEEVDEEELDEEESVVDEPLHEASAAVEVSINPDKQSARSALRFLKDLFM